MAPVVLLPAPLGIPGSARTPDGSSAGGLGLLIVPLALAGVVVAWQLVGRAARRKARLSADLGFDPGPVVRAARRWGSARINGLDFGRCIKVAEHRDGWVVRLLPLFGRGRLWLPKEGAQVGPMEPTQLVRLQRRTVTAGGHEVCLIGELADYVG